MNTSTLFLQKGEFAEAADIAGESYYEHTVERGPPAPAFHGQGRVDVGIVGGGFAGLSTALELAERGYSVALLEAQRLASAASGRNGGQLLPGYSCDMDVIAHQLGRADARRAWDLSIEGMDIVKERSTAWGFECDYKPGWMLLAARRGHVARLRQWQAALANEYGYGKGIELVAQPALPAWTTSDAYFGALVDHGAGHLNPLKLALGMRQACAQRGVALFENSPVARVVGGLAPVLETTEGELRCNAVVLAANVFIGSFDLPIANRVMSVGNTMIATEPLPAALADRILHRRYAACDTNFLLDYYRLTPDNRMLWGGGSTYLRHDAVNRSAALRDRMVQVYPELRDIGIAFSWGGLIDATFSRAPDLGRIGDAIYYMQGFSGHGLNVTAIGGRLVAEAIAGQPDRFNMMSRLRHRNFPGGAWLRRSGLALGAAYYQLRDLLA